ncbi:MAG: HU family DNA-binding protein, partial [Lachnospiraceae bacterium]|nr:HU family DNA-binding protein [Lachnospiraceae bacterium]
MNRVELVDAIAKEAGLTKVDADKALKAFTNTVSKELKKKG